MGGVIYRRQRRQSRALHHGLQPDRVADHFFPGRDRLHGRPRCGAERHHSQRREAGERGQQFRSCRKSRSWSAARLAPATTRCAARPTIRVSFSPGRMRATPSWARRRRPTPFSAFWRARAIAATRNRRRKNSNELRAKVKKTYEEQTDIRYGAARGWVDAIIQPHETRDVLVRLLQYVSRPMPKARFHTGVIQT